MPENHLPGKNYLFRVLSLIVNLIIISYTFRKTEQIDQFMAFQ